MESCLFFRHFGLLVLGGFQVGNYFTSLHGWKFQVIPEFFEKTLVHRFAKMAGFLVA